MKTYRMRVEAGILFDVQADSEEDATAKAAEIVARALDEGVDIPNIDTEEELVACRAYANEDSVPEVVTTLDTEEGD